MPLYSHQVSCLWLNGAVPFEVDADDSRYIYSGSSDEVRRVAMALTAEGVPHTCSTNSVSIEFDAILFPCIQDGDNPTPF